MIKILKISFSVYFQVTYCLFSPQNTQKNRSLYIHFGRCTISYSFFIKRRTNNTKKRFQFLFFLLKKLKKNIFIHNTFPSKRKKGFFFLHQPTNRVQTINLLNGFLERRKKWEKKQKNKNKKLL